MPGLGAQDGFSGPEAEADSSKPGFVIKNVYTQLPAEHSTSAVVIPTTSRGGYEGTINYTCELIKDTRSSSTPAECAMYPAQFKLSVNQTGGPEILIFGKGTKLPPGATMGSKDPAKPPMGLFFGAGGSALACCLLFGIPARRRSWRAALSLLFLLAAIGTLSACSSNAEMITVGTYTFKVTGTDSVDSSITASGTVTANVL